MGKGKSEAIYKYIKWMIENNNNNNNNIEEVKENKGNEEHQQININI